MRAIGISGVLSELGILSEGPNNSDVAENELIEGIKQRFDATANQAKIAINFAVQSGIVSRSQKEAIKIISLER